MKILKVYDKINRNIFHYDKVTGNIHIKEFCDDKSCITLIINTKLLNRENISFFSYSKELNGLEIEKLDITKKNIYYKITNEKGLIIHSETINLKEQKTVLEINRIYDECEEFIEIENHRGKKSMLFKVKNRLLNNFLNTKNNGNQQKN